MSVFWLTGNTGAGKTATARRLAQGQRNIVILDGDELREVWPGLGMSSEDRREQCLRVARLARMLDGQGMTVIVSVIAPYESLRHQIADICGCAFIYLPSGARNSKEFPYEPPISPVITVLSNSDK